MCNSGGWGCRNRGRACECNSQWSSCRPQYNSTCPGHLCRVQTGGLRSAGRTKTTWSDNPITSTTILKTKHLVEIRNALNAELSIRRLPTKTWGDPQKGLTSASEWAQIRDAITSCRNYDLNTWYYNNSTTTRVRAVSTGLTFTASYSAGKTISADGTQQIRQYINILQGTCICQCNYNCSCNCNYCTCNCNYCLCNANYSCTCQCNYSDERLKRDIEDLD